MAKMKRIFCCVFCAVLISAALAHAEYMQNERQYSAENADCSAYGGTKEWPEFRGLQPGLTLQAVAMREQSRGVDLRIFGSEESRLRDADAGYLTAVNMIGRDVLMYGERITVLYEFSSNVFSVAHGYAAFAEKADAQAYYDLIYADLCALYGKPEGKAKWSVGYGWTGLGNMEEQSAEGFGGSISIKMERMEIALGPNAAFFREKGFDIPEGGWLVTLGFADAYRVNGQKADEAFYMDSRVYYN